MKKGNRPRWGDLIEAEPDLAFLEDSIRSGSDEGTGTFCANKEWFERFEPRMDRLVGWNARNPALRTSEHWETAHRHLYEQLPACRGCACFPPIGTGGQYHSVSGDRHEAFFFVDIWDLLNGKET